MIDTKAVKNKILNLAMRGQLTEQIPKGESAEELYAEIIKEKAGLVKEGKIKKEKNIVDIFDEDAPFDIPSNWKWCKFGAVIVLVSGTDFNPEDYNDVAIGIPYVTGASNFLDDGVLVNRWTEKPRNIANEGDVLLVCKGSGYGKTAICDIPEAHIARQIMAVKKTDLLNMKYVLYFLKTNFDYIKSKGQGLIPGIDRKSVLNMNFPLPPTDVQDCIVEKIEAVFEILDKIEALQNQYAFNQEALKSKLIDAAIQGKLTEQLPEDGTAEDLYQLVQSEKKKLQKEGKIKKTKAFVSIIDEEIPFQLPSNWKWVRLGSVLNEVIVPQRDKPKRFDGDIPWCRIEDADGDYMSKSHSNQNVSQKIVEEMNLRIFPVGTILSACSGGSIGRILITTTELCTNQTFNGLVCSMGLYNRYLFHFLRNSIGRLKKMGSGAAMEYVSQKKIAEMLIPLPPLAEQHRIVEKLDALLSLVA